MPSRRTRRLRGFTYVGRHRYALTLHTADGRPYFRDASTVRRTRALFREAAAHTGFVLSAYCFMPDRLDLLVNGTTGTSDLRRFVTLAKQRTGHRHRRLFGAKLWALGYSDRILGPGEAAQRTAGDLLRNPWREGLVSDAREYPFLGSDVWSVEDLLATAGREATLSASGATRPRSERSI